MISTITLHSTISDPLLGWHTGFVKIPKRNVREFVSHKAACDDKKIGRNNSRKVHTILWISKLTHDSLIFFGMNH